MKRKVKRHTTSAYSRKTICKIEIGNRNGERGIGVGNLLKGGNVPFRDSASLQIPPSHSPFPFPFPFSDSTFLILEIAFSEKDPEMENLNGTGFWLILFYFSYIV